MDVLTSTCTSVCVSIGVFGSQVFEAYLDEADDNHKSQADYDDLSEEERVSGGNTANRCF